MDTIKSCFRRLLTLGSVAVWQLLAAGPVPAAQTGVLVGQITGPGGAGLPGAVVSAHLESGGEDRTTVTGENGEFRFTELEEGRYSVSGSSRGFHATSVDEVVVEHDRTTRVRLALSSATFSDTMEVRSGLPADALEANELRESAAADLGEALRRMAGVEKVRKGGVANDIVVRGYREDDVTVLIDGARVHGACPNRMDPPAYHLDFAELDRVEQVPSSSRISAQGSLGGMVNVVTKKPGAGLHVDVPVVVGSNDQFNPSATVSYGGDRFGVLGGVSHRSAAPYEDGDGDLFTGAANYNVDGLDSDAYSVTSAWTRAYFQPSAAHEMSVSYSRQESDEVLYPTLMMDAVYDDTDRLVLGYLWAPEGGVVDRLRATGYATKVEHWMTDALRTSSNMAPLEWGMGTMASTEVIGGSLEMELASFTVGAEAYSRSWDAWTELAMMSYARQYSIPDVSVDAVGAYARWQKALSASTELELGARVDRVSTKANAAKANTDLYYAYHGVRETSTSDTEPSASLQIVHRFGPRVSLGGGLSSTTRSPDPRERYFGLKRMGADWVGDPGLAPPRANRVEVELSWDLGATVLSLSTWGDQVSDYITIYEQERINMAPGVMNPRAKSYANVDAEIYGVTLQGSSALGERVFLAGNLSYLRGSKDADPERGILSTNLAEMPPLSARLALRWQSPRYFAEIEGLAAARQDRVDEDLNESETPGWAIANLKGGAQFGYWRVQLVLENLFDRTYHEHFSSQRDPFRSGVVLNEPGRRAALTVGFSL